MDDYVVLFNEIAHNVVTTALDKHTLDNRDIIIVTGAPQYIERGNIHNMNGTYVKLEIKHQNQPIYSSNDSFYLITYNNDRKCWEMGLNKQSKGFLPLYRYYSTVVYNVSDTWKSVLDNESSVFCMSVKFDKKVKTIILTSYPSYIKLNSIL